MNSKVTISESSQWENMTAQRTNIEFYDKIEPDFNVSRDLHV